MKTILRFAFGLTFMLLLLQNVKAQDTVTVSTVGDTTWFSLESACTVPQTLGGAYTGPADLTGYVLYDGETADNRIYARPAEDTEEELWALIPSGDNVFLMNKSTGRFMNQSHSLGDAGEDVEWGEYGDDQYYFNNIGATQIVIWNGLKCDRIDNGGKDSNTAYYIKQKRDTVIISMANDTTWFSVESACTVPETLGGAYVGPDTLTGYVLYDGEMGDARIYVREAEGTDEELWAFVQSGDDVFFQNKATGRFMSQSHSLVDVGEAVEWGEYGDGQYWINSMGQNPIAVWNDFKCDRITSAGKDSNTAFYVDAALKTLPVGIKHDVISAGNDIRAWSRYGIIHVEGTDAPYDIYSITGRRVRKNTKLEAGLYIVVTEAKSVKVIVSH